MPENTDLMATRYGQTPSQKSRQKALGITAGVGFALVLGSWLWWGGALETPAQLQVRDIAHVIESEQSVQVTYEVTTQPGTEVACAVQALNAAFGIVGWKTVSLEPSETWTRTFTETLRTSEPAVTGLLYECWLP
jgi:hypothetical protein